MAISLFLGSLYGRLVSSQLMRTYQDPTLPDLQAPTFDAALIWSATPLTNMKLRLATTADESTVPGVSDALRYDATLQSITLSEGG